MTFEQKIEQTIRKNNLIQNNDRVIIGVSGGADSVALLLILHDLQPKFNMSIEVCHVNHGLRPEAAREQGFVKALCNQYGIQCHVTEVNCEALAKQWGMSIEEAGRKVRYDFFEEIANGDKIATAHHMNDNVETVLMRMIRGTGLRGLAGIPYRRNNIVRPLLDVSRKEIEAYLKKRHQHYMTDGSNLVDIYTRNKIRLNIIPQIESQLNASFVDTMASSIQSFKEDAEYFQGVVCDAIDDTCFMMGDVYCIHKERFFGLHRSIQKRVFQKLIFDVTGFDPSASLLSSLADCVDADVGTVVDINQKYQLLVARNELLIKPVDAFQQNLTTVKASLNSVVSVGGRRIKITETSEHTPIQNTSTVFYLPYHLWTNNFEFRTRRNGDVVHITENMNKKLGRFFTDKKVDEYKRDSYWLLTNGTQKIYWIPDLFGARFQTRTGRFVKFEIL